MSVDRDQLVEDLTDLAERGEFGNAIEHIVEAVVEAVLIAVDSDDTPAEAPAVDDSRPMTLVDLPDDALPYAVVEACGFFDSDGDSLLAFRFAGDGPWTTQLGLLEAAKHHLNITRYDPGEE